MSSIQVKAMLTVDIVKTTLKASEFIDATLVGEESRTIFCGGV